MPVPFTEYKGRGADNLRCSCLHGPCKQWVLDEVHLTLIVAFHKNWKETLTGLGFFKSSIKTRHQSYGQIFWSFVTLWPALVHKRAHRIKLMYLPNLRCFKRSWFGKEGSQPVKTWPSSLHQKQAWNIRHARGVERKKLNAELCR